MIEKGSLITCDRCPATRFVPERCKDELQAGWTVQDGDKHLCPTCTDLWNKLRNGFFAPEVKRPINLEV